MPETFAKLSEMFVVCRSMDLLEQRIQLTADINTVVDAHVFVVWELLQVLLLI